MESIFPTYCGGTRCTCMLMVTHDCNLSCSYCYERFKSAGSMSFETAKAAILKEFDKAKNSTNCEGLEIDFMGGEPLLRFDLIRQIVKWLESEPPPVPFICFATTNGTLLDNQKKAWFERHQGTIWLGASVDGSEAMQRENRGASATNVDLDWFRRTWPEQEFHLTISRETLPSLAAGVKSLLLAGHSVNATMAQGVDWRDDDALTLASQLEELAQWQLNGGREFRPLNLLSRAVVLAFSQTQRQGRWCGSGHEMTTYDVDGTAYRCHLFTPLVVGERALPLDKATHADCSFADGFCDTCALRLYCPTCAGFNYRDRGEVNCRDKRWCRMVLANAQVAATFQIKRLAMENRLTAEEDVQVAKAALKAISVIGGVDLMGVRFPMWID